MKLRTLLFISLLPACADNSNHGPRFDIAVQPLTLGTIEGASYAITVRNAGPAPDNVVWSRTGLTSDRYGDGRGALSYVGPCDASADANPHKVELVLESLSGPTGPLTAGTWENPAPEGAPVIVEATCSENADTKVEINLTIMRDAQQGFFDVAVNFEDIFCSAKVDCQDALLHDGVDRGPTVVVGFACTAGTAADGAEPTWLHMTDLVLTCDGLPPLYVDPSAPTGQHGSLGTLPTVFETGIYRGQEELPGLDKCYWNSALGIAVGSAPNCRISGQATASHASFVNGATPRNMVYPYVDFDVLVSDLSGNLVCDNNGLDDPLSGVTTGYTTVGGAAFTHEWECSSGTAPVDHRVACDGAFGTSTAVSYTHLTLPTNREV